MNSRGKNVAKRLNVKVQCFLIIWNLLPTLKNKSFDVSMFLIYVETNITRMLHDDAAGSFRKDNDYYIVVYLLYFRNYFEATYVTDVRATYP